jgi:hypothetical protein
MANRPPRGQTPARRARSPQSPRPDIATLRARFSLGRYSISFTHTEKLRSRRIRVLDLEKAIANGRIIESYLDDPRGPSCLVLGWAGRRALHVVCACLDEEQILVVTAYEPSPDEWNADFETRARRKR